MILQDEAKRFFDSHPENQSFPDGDGSVDGMAGHYRRLAAHQYQDIKRNAKAILESLSTVPRVFQFTNGRSLSIQIDPDIMRDAILTQLHRAKMRNEDALYASDEELACLCRQQSSVGDDEFDTCFCAVTEVTGADGSEVLHVLSKEPPARMKEVGSERRTNARHAAMAYVWSLVKVLGAAPDEVGEKFGKRGSSVEIMIEDLEEIAGTRDSPGNKQLARKLQAIKQRIKSHFDIVEEIESA